MFRVIKLNDSTFRTNMCATRDAGTVAGKLYEIAFVSTLKEGKEGKKTKRRREGKLRKGGEEGARKTEESWRIEG